MAAVTAEDTGALDAHAFCGVALNRLSRRAKRDDLPALTWTVGPYMPVLDGQYIPDGITSPTKAISGWAVTIRVPVKVTTGTADRLLIEAEGWYAGARVRLWAYLDETTTIPSDTKDVA